MNISIPRFEHNPLKPHATDKPIFYLFLISKHGNVITANTRNPYDDEQKHPRNSSTLFIASVVGYIQAVKEKIINPTDITRNKGSYTIFLKENLTDLLNNIIIEHAWNEPLGTGEISIIDNISCLHASYYPQPLEKGYKIGVRYVA